VRRSRLAAAFLVFSTYMIAHGLHLRLHGFCLVGPAPSNLLIATLLRKFVSTANEGEKRQAFLGVKDLDMAVVIGDHP
jgi:hypothetical protein